MGSQALDHAARSMGFRDYATFQAYQAHQQAMRQGNPPVTAGTPVANAQQGVNPGQQPQAEAPQNWLQKLLWGLGGGK